MHGDADVRMMCAPPFGVPVIYGAGDAARETSGLFSETESPSDYGSFVRDPQLLMTDAADLALLSTFVVVPTADVEGDGALVGLKEDEALIVDGRNYQVRNFGPIEDGRMTRIRLAKG